MSTIKQTVRNVSFALLIIFLVVGILLCMESLRSDRSEIMARYGQLSLGATSFLIAVVSVLDGSTAYRYWVIKKSDGPVSFWILVLFGLGWVAII
jgi:tellurite resistance protein TehA-like permease